MTVSLKETIALAEKGVITDMTTIAEIVDDLLEVPYTLLEKMSGSFSFVRNISYSDRDDEFFEELTLKDVLGIVEQMREPGDETGRCCVIQSIAFGLFNSDSIPEIKRFLSVSVQTLMSMYSPKLYKVLRILTMKYSKFDVTDNMSVRDFIIKARDAIREVWYVGYDIDEYRDSIIGSTNALDLLLIRNIGLLLK